jgi:uncharacterized DUF497 family protein
VNFEWDPAKNLRNRAKHGLDFSDAPPLFGYPGLELRDDRDDYREDRLQLIVTTGGRVFVVVYTEPDEDTIRLISFRRASAAERRELDAFFAQRP